MLDQILGALMILAVVAASPPGQHLRPSNRKQIDFVVSDDEVARNQTRSPKQFWHQFGYHFIPNPRPLSYHYVLQPNRISPAASAERMSQEIFSDEENDGELDKAGDERVKDTMSLSGKNRLKKPQKSEIYFLNLLCFPKFFFKKKIKN